MEAKNPPTISLAPPPALISYRSLHVQPAAAIPLAINVLIMTLTTIYAWKLWQRGDKFYVEDTWREEGEMEQERPHKAMTTIQRPAIPATMSDTRVREGRVRTPESLIAVRQGIWSPQTTARLHIAPGQLDTPARVKLQHFRAAIPEAGVAAVNQLRRQTLSLATRQALARRGISSPFTMKANMPHDIQDPAWAPNRMLKDVNLHKEAPMAIGKPLQTSKQTLGLAPFFSLSIDSKASVSDEANSHSRECGSKIESDVGTGREGEYGPGSGSPNIPVVGSNDFRGAVQSTESRVGTDDTMVRGAASRVVRNSGIDWNDDEGSLVSSCCTRYSSEAGRDSYQDRYADY